MQLNRLMTEWLNAARERQNARAAYELNTESEQPEGLQVHGQGAIRLKPDDIIHDASQHLPHPGKPSF